MDKLSQQTIGGPIQQNFDQLVADRDSLLTALNALTVRVATLEATRFLFGGVNSTGAILHGTGFTITKGAAGIYTINFTVAFSGTPGLTFNPLNVTGLRNYDVVSASASSVQVIITTNAGVGIDTPFIFVATGPT